jgi:hypothetical protein
MNPILPGAIHPDLAGEMLEIVLLLYLDCSGGKRRT